MVTNPAEGSQTVVVQVTAPAYPYAAPPHFTSGPEKSKVAAGLLALFLGALGIHRFYLGYTGIGVAMLLITVLSLGVLAPIVALWALVQAIVIFCGGMKDSQGRVLA